MKNVEKWFSLGESRKLEDQVKYNIAMACEGGLNGYYDDNNDDKMTKQDWREYIYNTMQTCFETDWGTEMGEDAAKHLHFYGKKNTKTFIKSHGLAVARRLNSHLLISVLARRLTRHALKHL